MPPQELEETSASLPMIDLSPWLKPAQEALSLVDEDPLAKIQGRSAAFSLDQVDYDNPSPAQQACSRALHQACRDRGFFYLTHTSCEDQMEQILNLASDFFARPQSEKDALSIANSDRARGYQKLGENVTQSKADHHEGLDLYRPLPQDREDPNKTLHGFNQWPVQPADFKPVYEQWIEKLQWVGKIVMAAAAYGLGMDRCEADALLDAVDQSFWVLRAISYPQLSADAEGISCGAHKDYGAWTFLLTQALFCVLDETKGALQVWSTTTQEWLNADPVPGAFVVNIGEMWEVWTNGLYRATLHRVIHRGQRIRTSVPFFFEANFDAFVEPLAAALRIQEAEGGGDTQAHKKPGVVYGDLLTKKVSGNFSTTV